MNNPTIDKITACEILDSRGNPTVQADVTLMLGVLDSLSFETRSVDLRPVDRFSDEHNLIFEHTQLLGIGYFRAVELCPVFVNTCRADVRVCGKDLTSTHHPHAPEG